MGVRGVIFDFQEWLVRLKCILEAFGNGVPARKVTVKFEEIVRDIECTCSIWIRSLRNPEVKY